MSVSVPKVSDYNKFFSSIPTSPDEICRYIEARVLIAELESNRVIQDFSGFDWAALAKESTNEFENTRLFVEKYVKKLTEIETLKNDLVCGRYDLDKTSDFIELYNKTELICNEVIDSYVYFDWFGGEQGIENNWTFYSKYLKRRTELFSELQQTNESFIQKEKNTSEHWQLKYRNRVTWDVSFWTLMMEYERWKPLSEELTINDLAIALKNSNVEKIKSTPVGKDEVVLQYVYMNEVDWKQVATDIFNSH